MDAGRAGVSISMDLGRVFPLGPRGYLLTSRAGLGIVRPSA
jgi:hypothetical protein